SCTTSASRIARTIGTHTLARLLTLSRAPEVVLGGLNGSRRSGPSGSGGHGDRGPHPVAPHLSEDEPGRTGGEDRRLVPAGPEVRARGQPGFRLQAGRHRLGPRRERRLAG